MYNIIKFDSGGFNMKKIKSFALIALCLIMALSFGGCAKKDPVTSQVFGDTMTQNGYTVKDIKEQYSDLEFITEAYLAVDETESYQIEFYVLSDKDRAVKMFDGNKQNLEENKDSTHLSTSVSAGNHGKYTLTTDSEYVLISRIDNTMVFAKTAVDYKDAVNTMVETLGY